MPRNHNGPFKCPHCARGFSTDVGRSSHTTQVHRDKDILYEEVPSTIALGSDAATQQRKRRRGTTPEEGHSPVAQAGSGDGPPPDDADSAVTDNLHDDTSDEESDGDESEEEESIVVVAALDEDEGDAEVADAPQAVNPIQPGDGPINAGILSRPKVEALHPAPSLTPTQQKIGAWMYEHSANGPGDELLGILHDPDIKLEELPKTAATLKEMICNAAAADQPLFQVLQHRLTFSACSKQPPLKSWTNATVASRGVLAAVLSTWTNPRTTHWDHMFHFKQGDPPKYPQGVADEPFYSADCRRGCEQAVARGRALGWKGHIEANPLCFSHDDMDPTNASSVILSPIVAWNGNQPHHVRRSVTAGEHVMLLPQIPVGKCRTPQVTRDARAALQEGIKVFVDQFNELHRRGVVIHGSHIPGCPIKEDILIMPFAHAGCFDASAAWAWMNMLTKYCYVCPADYSLSWDFTTNPLPSRSAMEIYNLRRDANAIGDSAAVQSKRRDALAKLDKLFVHPEETALDCLATVQNDGKYNLVVDPAHCLEGGIFKAMVGAVKDACGDTAACSERDHGVATASAIVDDIVKIAGGHNTGYHRIPAVNGFTSVRVFSFMMIRSLLFSILAALLSVSALFNDPLQTAMICAFAYSILLMRSVYAARWTVQTPKSISTFLLGLRRNWDTAFGKYYNWRRPKVHLPVHWFESYLRLGTPVHFSTMLYIEATQRILKAAHKHTSKRADAAFQVLKRLSVLRWIYSTLRPAAGFDDNPIAALQNDRGTQAFLTGTLKSVAGVNTLYADPVGAGEIKWNRSLNNALHAMKHPSIPDGHIMSWNRVYPRRSATLVRKGICAVSVQALPAMCSENGTGSPICAVLSGFVDVPQPGVPPGGAAAPAAPGGAAAPLAAAPKATRQQSERERYVVDFWFSYDITGLDEDPNAEPKTQLTLAQQNDPKFAVDLAVARELLVQPTITATGNISRETAAAYVFQRVKAAPKPVIVDLADLCQPLWTFPFLGSVTDAKTFFSGTSSKWSTNHWLIAPKLY